MLQSSFPALTSSGSSTALPWFSYETLKRITPGYRALVDAALIFFGGAIALAHLPVSSHLLGTDNGWKLNFFATTNFLSGMIGQPSCI